MLCCSCSQFFLIGFFQNLFESIYFDAFFNAKVHVKTLVWISDDTFLCFGNRLPRAYLWALSAYEFLCFWFVTKMPETLSVSNYM